MFDRREIMKAAWEIFGKAYSFPEKHSFNWAGRKCFAWAMREAWRQAKEAARKAGFTVCQIATRIADIKGQLLAYEYSDCWTPRLAASASTIRAELAELQTRLAA